MSRRFDIARKPFITINELSRIFHNRMCALADEHGLNESYRHLLFHLAHDDGMTQLELARSARLKPPTVSVTLQKMEEEGYVERHCDENDRCATRVYLTEKGKRFENESHKLVESIDARALDGMTDEETKALMELLGKVYYNLTGETVQDKFARCEKRGGKTRK